MVKQEFPAFWTTKLIDKINKTYPLKEKDSFVRFVEEAVNSKLEWMEQKEEEDATV
jgi:hypothetical protein